MSHLHVKKYLYLQWLFPIGIRCRTRIVLPLKWCQCTLVSNKSYFSHWIKMIKVFWHYYATFVGGGNGNPPQYSCLENPVDSGAWWAAVHRVAQSQTQLKQLSMHALEKEMATHSSILAWRIPGREEPGGLLSVGSHTVRHDWSDLAAAAAEPCKSIHVAANSKILFFFMME